MPFLHRKIFWIPSLILLMLLMAWLLLPSVLRYYVQKQLNSVPGYQSTLTDVDVNLLLGQYTLQGLKINKVNKVPVPFFSAKSVKISLQWRPLLHGELVGKVYLKHPQLNFVTAAKQSKQQLTINEQWEKVAKSLFFLPFNRVDIDNGEIHYRSLEDKQPFNIYLKHLDASLENMQEAIKTDKDPLPGRMQLTATTIGNANLNVTVDFDPNNKQPKFDLTAKLKNMDLKKSNDFFKHYTKLKMKSGTFSLFVEAAAKNGAIKGYAKPILKKLRISGSSPAHPVYIGNAKVLRMILENDDSQQIGTKVLISEKIDDPTLSTWSIVINLLKNSFLKSLLPQIDHNIDIKSLP